MSKVAIGVPLVRAWVAFLCGAAAISLASPQVIAAEAEDDEIELEEVQVTGTRIQARGYNTPNPVTTITGDDLKKLGIVNVADALTTLVPQNLSNTQPANTGFSSFYVGQTFANLSGLNNVDAFGTTIGSRTLTLIDGRRTVSSSNLIDAVDLNVIPSNLLQRADVVEGGASATYGSGAMAGVVNLVLNNRLQGVNVDMDYSIHEAGDGESPHIAISAGTRVGQRGTITVSGEYQKSDAIQGCGGRLWCENSSNLIVNSANAFLAPASAFTPLPGYEDLPFRFAATNVRYNQWAPNGAIAVTNNSPASMTNGLRLVPTAGGLFDVQEYALGLNGRGAGQGSVVNGDGPLATAFTTLAPASDRKTGYSHFEFDFTDRTTGYAEVTYAKTGGVNRIIPMLQGGQVCTRFDDVGQRAQQGATLAPGALVRAYDEVTQGNPDPLFSNPQFLAFIGLTPAQWAGLFLPAPGPTLQNAVANWTDGAAFGLPGTVFLANLTLTAPFSLPDSPAVLPTVGDNSYAFLSQLTPEALLAVRQAALQGTGPNLGNAPNSGNGTESLWLGGAPCNGGTSFYKVWNPQIEMNVENNSRRVNSILGLRGRFGESWRWDSYYSYGETKSSSLQTHAQTSYALAFALDAVLDDDGNPVCRVTRDGVQAALDPDGDGRNFYNEPFDFDALAQIAQGCQPLNIFGQNASQAALDYAYTNQTSAGTNKLHVLSFNTSGTLWNGWAGPLTGAFGIEGRKDSVANSGTRGAGSELQDILFAWPDAYGGSTRVTEQYAEFNLPLVSEVEGLKLLSINGAIRAGQYRNKGGTNTTGESGTQRTTNWKFSSIIEPFDWARLRLTRSRDLRAAGYRELYLNQQGVQDAGTANNLWRSSTDTTAQSDRVANNFGGNPDLNPEKSDTLTVGFVLSPGGWAQGLRMSVDYRDIKVKDGLTQTFNPLQQCWQASGNTEPEYVTGPGGTQVPVPGTGVNGLFDPENEFCQQLQFWDVAIPGYDGPDSTAPCGTYGSAGFICLNNLKSVSTSYENSEPYRIRGVVVSGNYAFPLNRMLESLPGSIGLSLTANRALEASGNGTSFFCPGEYDYVGQLSSGLGCNPGVQPTPKWAGNASVSYSTGGLQTTLGARYVGAAKIDKVFYADAPGQNVFDGTDVYEQDGQFRVGSIVDNNVPSYINFTLNATYNLSLPGVKQFQVFGTVNNLFDKDPPLTGGTIAGGNPMFHDIYGRSYRMGVRMNF